MSRVDEIKSAAEEALKGTPLEDARIYLARRRGVGEGPEWTAPKYDLLIAGARRALSYFRHHADHDAKFVLPPWLSWVR